MLSFLTRLDDELGEGPRNWSWRIWLPLSIGSLVAWTVLSVCREVDRFDRRYQENARL